MKRLASAALGSAALAAQAQPAPAANSLEASYRFSAQSDAEIRDSTRGELETSMAHFRLSRSFAVSEKLGLEVGLRHQQVFIDATGGLPVPDTLRSAEIELGATWRFSQKWAARVVARPGIYSDGESFDRDGFNAPVIALASWQLDPSLTLFGGVLHNSFSENAVIPLLGARWQATSRLALTVGAPRTEISLDLGRGQKAFIAVSAHGGEYHLDDPSLTAPAGYPGLRDTEVSYREIHLGAGFAWPLTKTISAEIEVSWMLDRRFDFNDRGLVVKSDPAPSARFALNARF